MNTIKLLSIILLILIVVSCGNELHKTPVILFSDLSKPREDVCGISDDYLAQIEGIQCDDSNLMVLDYHSGKSFTLFELNSGKMIGRFGSIGQGAGEIPLGTYGYLENNYIYISYEHTGYVGKYEIDSLCSNIEIRPKPLAKFKIPEAQLSRIIPINDSIFLGAGTYKSEYQYLLFNKNSNVIDYAIKIYNEADVNMNKYHKFLSNQGNLRKRPGKNQFVYSINMSSNIDFIEIKDDKIELIKSLRLNDPIYKPIHDSKLNRVVPVKDNIIGYIDVCATEHYVYALYTDKKMYDNNKSNSFSSNIVLVFDWSGNPVIKYELVQEAYYISIDENSRKMYGAIKNDTKGWSIISYNIK